MQTKKHTARGLYSVPYVLFLGFMPRLIRENLTDSTAAFFVFSSS